jgi:hypothetical protein
MIHNGLYRYSKKSCESKYRAKRIVVDGVKFDSKREFECWTKLRALEKSGAINNLQRQVVFVLAPAVVLDGRKKTQLKYVADFTYEENGKQIVADAKGMKTPVYRIKKHLMKSVLGLDVVEL